MTPHLIGLVALLAVSPASAQRQASPLEPLVRDLQFAGDWPANFCAERLKEVDLLVFDDVLHPAVEPFRFYREFLSRTDIQERVRFVFVEAFPVNHQKHIDAYLATAPEDTTLLAPLFRDDFSGTGWRLQTYLDLMRDIYALNADTLREGRYEVVAVSNPVYWEGIHDAEDLALFRKALAGRDYFMYRLIRETMGSFEAGEKGIFLTNTRHAYKGIRHADGELYWNTNTFLHQWHPGVSYSIRIHNLQLFIERIRASDPGEPATTAGMERFEYRMGRIADGLWDSAFAANGNRQVAVPLEGTAFGQEPYVGNHMRDVAPGQTMSDAYDAVMFLAPVEEMHFSATFDWVYPDSLLPELERRFRILFTDEQLAAQMEAEGAGTLKELIEDALAPLPRRPLPYLEGLEPMDAWKAGGN